LGMHCMNEDFSDLLILPPFNTLRAQVIRRGHSPDILHGNEASVRFSIPSNTRSSDKTNFWTYDEALLGVDLPPDTGLTGLGLSGTMTPTAHRTYEAVGIPITPIDDTGRINSFPLAFIEAVHENGGVANTVTVVPVSTELTCNLCHSAPGVSTGTDILRDHDKLHGTNLEATKPILCASCHKDNALALPGLPDVPQLSHAIHSAHAPRMDMVDLDNTCYACHPGLRTKCQRDNHFGVGVDCMECHGGMEDVGNAAREPWVDLPRCEECHNRPGFDFEPPGVLYKNATGHGGVMCVTCHGTTHATGPTVTATDNLQAQLLQGYSGPLNNCLVCHTSMPEHPFFHSADDD
ncbi:MAG: hypothetical protein KC983_02855, partial [Phycisphaerales bacterium]|nr:hypothetical protein [Phycisphaerales bacterium]